MILSHAARIAHKYFKLLAPYCTQIEIAGSIRRQAPLIKDIELVCIPIVSAAQPDLFSPGDLISSPHPGFIAAVNSIPALKGSPSGRYTQRALPDGIILDLFIANPLNYGYILAIRTGPAAYSQYLVTRAKRCGFNFKNGHLTVNNRIIPVPTESDLFLHLNLAYLDPQFRCV